MNRRIVTYIFFIASLFFGLIVFAESNLENGEEPRLHIKEKVESRETIIVGDDIDYPPYSYLDKDGNPQGFNLDLIQEVANTVGYNVEFRLDEWKDTREALDRGDIDIISGMFQSKGREEEYAFTTTHARTTGDIFTADREELSGLNDLRGKKVVVQSMDVVHEYLISQELGIDFIEVSTVSEGLDLIASGNYRYGAFLSIPANYIIDREGYEDIIPQGLSINKASYAMAANIENKEIIDTLNSGLYILKSSGRYEEIYDKWLGVYEERSLETFIKKNWISILAIVTSIIVIIALLLSWNRTLKKMVSKRTEELARSNKELIENKEHIEYLAYNDYLTGLPNRARFNTILDKEIKSGSKGAVMMLDIDNFKSINDISGHAFGDKVLKEIARILNDNLDEKFFISRFGGDEFLILLKDESDVDTIRKHARDILFRFRQNIYTDERKVNLSFSMGISLFPKDGSTVEVLLMKADTAMHLVKSAGKRNFAFFNRSMQEDLRRKMEIKDIIKDAFVNEGFYLLYQPQISCKDGKIAGFEALIRLKDKAIYPDQFIPVAEESGFIMDIGRWVTETVIKQLKDWQNKGYELKPIAINFSAKQLKDDSFHDFLKSRLEKYRIDPKYIEIEITEGILLENTRQAIDYLQRFRNLGVSIALDDFGTGYSSISYLTYIPVDKIKLDKTLNDEFLDMDNMKVMESIISLGHSLNLKITAEGIEQKKQLERLVESGCDYIQGYLFSKPVEAEEIEKIYDKSFMDI